MSVDLSVNKIRIFPTNITVFLDPLICLLIFFIVFSTQTVNEKIKRRRGPLTEERKAKKKVNTLSILLFS